MDKNLEAASLSSPIKSERVRGIILQHPNVQEAIVLLRKRKNQDIYIIAYVVLHTETQKTREALHCFISEHLLLDMRPETIIFLEKFPLTPEGEIDHRALLTLQLLSKVRAGSNNGTPQQGNAEASHINHLMQHIEAQKQKPAIQAPALPQLAREQLLPTSFAQQRLWFTTQLDPANPFYNMYEVLQLTGPLNLEALSASLRELMVRQESLRTRFVVREGIPWQEILPTCELELPLLDLQTCPPTQQESEAHRLLQQFIHIPFVLDQAPLLRVQLIRLHPHRHLLVLCLHHIISDGWSQGILLRELTSLYRSHLLGIPSSLPPLPYQPADFAHWQRQMLQGETLQSLLSYWQQQLHAAPPLLSLPTDAPRPPQQRYRGKLHFFTLPAELSDQVRQVARRSGCTLFMVLLTAFALLLQRYSGQDDLVIGTDVAGRTRQEIEDVVGFFVNMLPLRVQIGGKKTGRQLLEQVREILLAAYAHQDLPFEKLVEVLQPERTLSYHPLFQVKLVLQNTPQSDLSFPDVSIQHIKVENTTARFDLLLNITDSSPALHGHLEYNTDLFTSSTAIYLLEMFEYILLQLVNTLDQKVDEYNKVLSDFEQQRREHKAQQVHEASRQKMQSIKRKRVF